MFEDKPRKIVYIEKKDEVGLWCRKEEYYACPECGNRYDWADRTREGNRQYFCSGCGNFLSWAKLDYENHKETDTSFDKGMAFWQFLQDLRYGHTWENEVSMTYSHSEKEILEGCLAQKRAVSPAGKKRTAAGTEKKQPVKTEKDAVQNKKEKRRAGRQSLPEGQMSMFDMGFAAV